MRVFKYELKKLLKNPLLWGLLAVFIAFDTFIIYNDVGCKQIHNDIKETHSVIIDVGLNLDENSDKLSSMLRSDDQYPLYYASYIESYKASYDTLDMQDIKQMKEEIGSFYPTGSYKEFIDGNYEKLQKRVEEIKSTGDDSVGFYPGDGFKVHKRLYTLLMFIIIEMLIMMCFSTLYLMDFERINRTEDLVFSSEIGRKNMPVKWLAGITMGFIYCLILLILGLGVFLAFVPMNGLWSVPISSYMVMESSGLWEYPFITFVRLTTAQHLALSVITALLTALLFGVISGAVQFFIGSSYITMISTAASFIGLLALPFAVSSASWIKTAFCLNPASMWLECTRWFIENDLCISFAWNEFWMLGIWGIFSVLCFIVGINHFKNKNL